MFTANANKYGENISRSSILIVRKESWDDPLLKTKRRDGETTPSERSCCKRTPAAASATVVVVVQYCAEKGCPFLMLRSTSDWKCETIYTLKGIPFSNMKRSQYTKCISVHDGRRSQPKKRDDYSTPEPNWLSSKLCIFTILAYYWLL